MRDDWPDTVLGELVRIRSGVSPANAALTEQGRHPFVKVDDLNLSKKYLGEARQFTENDQLCVPAGSILFAKRGAAIMVNKVRVAARQLALDTNMMALTPVRGRIDGEFLYYFILHEELAKIADVSSIPQINNKHINPYPISLPPLPEQRKIAEFLRTWDEALEKLTALRAAKVQRLDGLAARLIHGEQAERLHLRDFLSEVSTRNRGQQVERVLSVTNSAGFVLAEDQFAHRVASADLSNYKIVRRGQYAYNPSRINVGSIARLDAWEDGALSPMYVVFRVRNGLDSDFFRHWLRSAEARQRIALAAQGSVRETVSFGDLGSILIPVPTIERQQSISRALNAGREEIALIEAEIEALTRQKRGLMQKLLTGEWRVSP